MLDIVLYVFICFYISLHDVHDAIIFLSVLALRVCVCFFYRSVRFVSHVVLQEDNVYRKPILFKGRPTKQIKQHRPHRKPIISQENQKQMKPMFQNHPAP